MNLKLKYFGLFVIYSLAILSANTLVDEYIEKGNTVLILVLGALLGNYLYDKYNQQKDEREIDSS